MAILKLRKELMRALRQLPGTLVPVYDIVIESRWPMAGRTFLFPLPSRRMEGCLVSPAQLGLPYRLLLVHLCYEKLVPI